MGRAKMDILEEIKRLRKMRGWSEYELSVRSNVPQSTISTCYGKGQVPTLFSLEKICEAFDITLSQFFSGGEDMVYITEEQRKLLDRWSALTRKQQELFLELFESI